MSTDVNTPSGRNSAGRSAWICLAIAWLCFLIPVPGTGVFAGWPLNVVAFILAIVAMAKGGAKKGLFQLLGSIVLSPVVYLIGVGILAAAIGPENRAKIAADAQQMAKVGAMMHASSANSARVTASDNAAVAAVQITAVKLHKAYQANAVAADQIYKGSKLAVTGVVREVSKEILSDAPIVMLAGTDEIFGIKLQGLSTAEAGPLRQGQKITATCTGAGDFAKYPVLDDCVLAGIHSPN